MYDAKNGWAANRGKNKGCGIAALLLMLVLALLIVGGCAEDKNWQKQEPADNGLTCKVLSVLFHVSLCHDTQRGVTCWLTDQGISCLPDSEVSW